MNSLPLHPAIVHLPLGLAIVAPLLAFGIGIAIRRGALPAKSWLIVVGLQAMLFVGGLAALRTGEQDEERAEDRVAENLIERHETLAERFVWSAGGTLALGTAVLVVRSLPATATLMAATMLAAVVTAGAGLQVGHTGGAIVHGPAGTAAIASGETAGAGERDEDD
jgi:uncharacterized membrane protein